MFPFDEVIMHNRVSNDTARQINVKKTIFTYPSAICSMFIHVNNKETIKALHYLDLGSNTDLFF